MTNQLKSLLAHANAFGPRHLSPTAAEVASMLETIGVPDLERIVDESIPSHIRMEGRLDCPTLSANGKSSTICAHWRARIRFCAP